MQLFQLVTLFLRDSIEELPKFNVKLDGIALNRRLIEASIAREKSFVRSPQFTERDFFSDNGIGQLVFAVTAAATVPEESCYEHSAKVMPVGYETTVVDLMRAYDAVIVRRKGARDTSEGWLIACLLRISLVVVPQCHHKVHGTEKTK